MNFNITTIEDIEELINISDSEEIKRISRIFLSAINDWPNNIPTIEEFIKEISIDFSGLMHKDVELYSKQYEANSSAWKLESASILLDLWNGRDTKQSIKDIASEIFEARKETFS